MAWFLNHYECDECGRRWDDEWSCMCDDECPHCGARNMSPYESDDLTDIIVQSDGEFVIYHSPKAAEHRADYREVARFPTAEEAARFLAGD